MKLRQACILLSLWTFTSTRLFLSTIAAEDGDLSSLLSIDLEGDLQLKRKDDEKGNHIDGFGLEIAVEGDLIAVTSIGSAFIFKRNGSNNEWTKVQQFDTVYSSPVAIDQNVVFVGDQTYGTGGIVHVLAPGTATKVPSVKVIASDQDPTSWAQEQIIAPPDTSSYGFGLNVAACEGTLVVSSVGKDGFGSVYSYTRNEKATSNASFQLREEVPISPRDDSNAGRAMAVYGNKLVLGGNSHMYLYLRNSKNEWKQTHRLGHLLLGSMSRSIALYENTVVVGNNPPIYPFGQGGSVTVYDVEHGVFVKKQTIIGWLSGFFGLSVALSGDTLVVGAPEEVYVYERKKKGGRFVRTQKLVASDGKKGRMDLFGQHVAIDGDVILVGAYLKDGPGGGSAYVFSRKENGKWTQDQELKGDDP